MLRPRRHVAVLLGAALALAGFGHDHEPLRLGAPPAAGPPVLWVADRGAHRLIGLDADLFVARTIVVRSPTRVLGDGAGGLWVASAREGRPDRRWGLLRLDASGALQQTVPCGRVRAVVVLSDGTLAWIEDEPGGGRRVQLAGAGGVRLLCRSAGASALAPAPHGLGLGTLSGGLSLLDRSGRALAVATLEGPVLDLAAAPDGGFWALHGEGPSLLTRLAPDLGERWNVATGIEAHRLVPDGTDVWVLARTRGHLCRYDARGTRVLDRRRLALTDLRDGCALERDLVVASPGGLQRIDPAGRLHPGQGGFAFAVSVAGPGD